MFKTVIVVLSVVLLFSNIRLSVIAKLAEQVMRRFLDFSEHVESVIPFVLSLEHVARCHLHVTSFHTGLKLLASIGSNSGSSILVSLNLFKNHKRDLRLEDVQRTH